MLQILSRFRLIVALIAAVFCGGVFAAGGLLLAAQATMPKLQADAEAHLAEIDRYFISLDESFERLSAIQAAECSLPVLQEFQREMFRNTYLLDIIFLAEDSLTPLCSATLGIMQDAQPLPRPDSPDLFQPERMTWYALPLGLFADEQAAYTVMEGRIAISSSTRTIEAPKTSYLWQSYFPNLTGTGEYLPIAGTMGLHPRLEAQKHALVPSIIGYEACAIIIPSCLTLAADWPMLLEQEKTYFHAGLAVMAIAAALTFHAVNRRLANAGSKKGRLASALKQRRSFQCVYQPIIELTTGKPIGCEVLARFEDSIGRISPGEMVPMLLEMGKSWEFTEFVLETALEDLKPVTDANPDFRVSVNFYPQDLDEAYLARIQNSAPIRQAIEEGILLNFEVLETGLHDGAKLGPVLGYIRDQGFSISIDDFGTGSSNLLQLRGIQAHYLKIDRSFVGNLNTDTASVRSSLVHHIVEIAREMQVEVIAEGVENATQLHVLNDLGIRFAQGFFFSPGVSSERLRDFLRTEEAIMELRSLQPQDRALTAPRQIGVVT